MSTYTPEGLDDAYAPDDAVDPADGPPAPPTLPQLGAVGWLRWAWRQLTSMRVALLLLMLLAVAAVPGSVWPQRSQAPERVAQYLVDHPTAGPWLERAGMFEDAVGHGELAATDGDLLAARRRGEYGFCHGVAPGG